ncbi:12334_t:CDS:2 [Ambispora gerdemannii]|uniref:12334_t:CDS:1 n=1 Tax=Ambispora gerdemannii TaxID=144530 RepID=A0A9N9G4Q2_9GLOM|nr:12334_t:CDS:2 [Ambispora gerdemannii]
MNQTKITLLDIEEPIFQELRDQFTMAIPEATVTRILKIEMPERIIKRHQKFAAKMSKKHKTDLQTITHSMFYGATYYCCDPITRLETKAELCENKECTMCGILRKGNKMRKAKNRWWWWKKSAISSSNDPANSLTDSLKQRDQHPYIMFVLDVLSPLPGYTLKVFNKAATIPKYLIIFEYIDPDEHIAKRIIELSVNY